MDAFAVPWDNPSIINALAVPLLCRCPDYPHCGIRSRTSHVSPWYWCLRMAYVLPVNLRPEPRAYFPVREGQDSVAIGYADLSSGRLSTYQQTTTHALL
jgi:hypothetical protein